MSLSPDLATSSMVAAIGALARSIRARGLFHQPEAGVESDTTQLEIAFPVTGPPGSVRIAQLAARECNVRMVLERTSIFGDRTIPVVGPLRELAG